VEIVGYMVYADDWAIYTSEGFRISVEKTIAMHICRKRNHDHSDPQIRLNGQILEVKNTHKILGITFDNRLTWKAHITEAKAAKRMNVLISLAETNWGADQGMLLRIHEMFILSALEYSSGWSQ
jgi:hypothetical protein